MEPTQEASEEDALEAVSIREKIEIGLRQHAAGHTLTHEEAMKRLGTWLNRPGRTEEPKS